MKYAKAYVSAIIAILTTVQVALDHGPVSQQQWITLGIGALVSLLGVWAVPNTQVTSMPVAEYQQTAVAAATGVLREPTPLVSKMSQPTPPAV